MNNEYVRFHFQRVILTVTGCNSTIRVQSGLKTFEDEAIFHGQIFKKRKTFPILSQKWPYLQKFFVLTVKPVPLWYCDC